MTGGGRRQPDWVRERRIFARGMAAGLIVAWLFFLLWGVLS